MTDTGVVVEAGQEQQATRYVGTRFSELARVKASQAEVSKEANLARVEQNIVENGPGMLQTNLNSAIIIIFKLLVKEIVNDCRSC